MNSKKYSKKKIALGLPAIIIAIIVINGVSDHYYQKLDETRDNGKIGKEQYNRGLFVPMIILWGIYFIYRRYDSKKAKGKQDR